MPQFPNVGAGFAPAGVTDGGWGIPATASTPGGAVFADPATGKSLDTRRLDPTTGQFVFDPTTGLIQGVTSAQQLMHLAIATAQGSAAVSKMGQTLSQIKDLNNSTSFAISAAVRTAVSDLIQQKIVTLESVVVSTIPNPDGQYITIKWTDLLTKERHTSFA